MVQASISNERDFDRFVEALTIQHPRIDLRESQRRATGKGKDGFKLTIQTLAGFAGKVRANTPAAEHLERVPITRTSSPLKITFFMMKT